jgi:RNase adaptor protein for sRNA GlmZ degradation
LTDFANLIKNIKKTNIYDKKISFKLLFLKKYKYSNLNFADCRRRHPLHGPDHPALLTFSGPPRIFTTGGAL